MPAADDPLSVKSRMHFRPDRRLVAEVNLHPRDSLPDLGATSAGANRLRLIPVEPRSSPGSVFARHGLVGVRESSAHRTSSLGPLPAAENGDCYPFPRELS
jgi:hypothetical protein